MTFNTILLKRLVSILAIVVIAKCGYALGSNHKYKNVLKTRAPIEVYTTESENESTTDASDLTDSGHEQTSSDLETTCVTEATEVNAYSTDKQTTCESDLETTTDSDSDTTTTTQTLVSETLSESETSADTTVDTTQSQESYESQTTLKSEIESTESVRTTEFQKTTKSYIHMKPIITTRTAKKTSKTTVKLKVTTNKPQVSDTTEETNPEEDVGLQASLDVMTHDYEMNGEQINATEAPDMDPNAELVDENGQKDSAEGGEDHKEESRPTTTTDKSQTRVTKARFGELRMGVTPKPEPKQKGMTPKPEPKQNLGLKVEKIVNNKLDEIKDWLNMTKVSVIQTCLESMQDSGFWCPGNVGKLSIRYYYHPDRKSCDCFLYYGCYGNKNNFQTLKECKDKCEKFGYTKATKDKSLKINDCSINP